MTFLIPSKTKIIATFLALTDDWWRCFGFWDAQIARRGSSGGASHVGGEHEGQRENEDDQTRSRIRLLRAVAGDNRLEALQLGAQTLILILKRFHLLDEVGVFRGALFDPEKMNWKLHELMLKGKIGYLSLGKQPTCLQARQRIPSSSSWNPGRRFCFWFSFWFSWGLALLV